MKKLWQSKDLEGFDVNEFLETHLIDRLEEFEEICGEEVSSDSSACPEPFDHKEKVEPPIE